MVEPGKYRKVTKLKDDLDSLQKTVIIGADYQGFIEIVGIGNGVCIMRNEEDELVGLEGNRRLGNDILAGLFYAFGDALHYILGIVYIPLVLWGCLFTAGFPKIISCPW